MSSILSGITVVGRYDSDALSTRSLGSTDSEEQFHNILVNWWASRLYDVDMLADHIIQDLNMGFSICETYHFGGG